MTLEKVTVNRMTIVKMTVGNNFGKKDLFKMTLDKMDQ